MIYVAIGFGVYLWIALEIVRADPPDSYGEVLGAVFACGLVAAVWPLVLLWRGMLGPAPRL